MYKLHRLVLAKISCKKATEHLKKKLKWNESQFHMVQIPTNTMQSRTVRTFLYKLNMC